MSISKKLIIGAGVAVVAAGGIAAKMTFLNEGEGPAGEGVKIVAPAASAGAAEHEAGEGH